jgi:hypothetical protein
METISNPIFGIISGYLSSTEVVALAAACKQLMCYFVGHREFKRGTISSFGMRKHVAMACIECEKKKGLIGGFCPDCIRKTHGCKSESCGRFFSDKKAFMRFGISFLYDACRQCIQKRSGRKCTKCGVVAMFNGFRRHADECERCFGKLGEKITYSEELDQKYYIGYWSRGKFVWATKELEKKAEWGLVKIE